MANPGGKPDTCLVVLLVMGGGVLLTLLTIAQVIHAVTS